MGLESARSSLDRKFLKEKKSFVGIVRPICAWDGHLGRALSALIYFIYLFSVLRVDEGQPGPRSAL